jgi:hypothetical protein
VQPERRVRGLLRRRALRPQVAVAAGAAAAGAAATASAVSRLMMATPSETLSPTFTLMSRTVPAVVEGTSIVALSDSSVISGASFAIVSPGATRISMTGTSAKPPMSGIVMSIKLIRCHLDCHRGCHPEQRRGAAANVHVGGGASTSRLAALRSA